MYFLGSIMTFETDVFLNYKKYLIYAYNNYPLISMK